MGRVFARMQEVEHPLWGVGQRLLLRSGHGISDQQGRRILPYAKDSQHAEPASGLAEGERGQR
ncbi:MAG: hypothetical protein DDT19_02267 [Syntrophomonadaceae bacterium]|nr:hypothetical protein [Bacillota bacterium]